MALIDNSPFTPNIRGKIGGSSFSNSLGGRTIKNAGSKSKNTSYQAQFSKSLLVNIANQWTLLREDTRQSWNYQAVFKPTSQKRNLGKFINGQQYFMIYQYAYYLKFGSFQPFPDANAWAFPLITPSINLTAGRLYFNTGVNIDEGEQFIVLKLSSSITQSRNQARGGLKFIQTNFGNSSQSDITAYYQLVFGVLPTINSYVIGEFRVYSITGTAFTNTQRYKFLINP